MSPKEIQGGSNVLSPIKSFCKVKYIWPDKINNWKNVHILIMPFLLLAKICSQLWSPTKKSYCTEYFFLISKLCCRNPAYPCSSICKHWPQMLLVASKRPNFLHCFMSGTRWLLDRLLQLSTNSNFLKSIPLQCILKELAVRRIFLTSSMLVRSFYFHKPSAGYYFHNGM